MLSKRILYSWLFVLLFCKLEAQDTHLPVFTREMGFTTENDAYLMQKKDAYYTNGLFFSVNRAGNRKGDKTISGFELGQMIYTPLIRKTVVLEDIDRPYCGYLFLAYHHTRFHLNGAIIQFSGAISQMGRASLGEDLQNSYHKLFAYSRFTGWQYQVSNATGIDLGASWAKTLMENSRWMKLVPRAELKLGTTFTNASLGTYLVLGSFEADKNSALWNARIQTTAAENRRKQEFFLFWYPQLIWQGYNGTIEGGMLQKGIGAVLGSPERMMFQQKIGLCYANNRLTAGAEWVYQSKEAIAQTRNQQYGSLTIRYLMH